MFSECFSKIKIKTNARIKLLESSLLANISNPAVRATVDKLAIADTRVTLNNTK